MTTATATRTPLVERVMERLAAVSGRHPDPEYIDLGTVERVLREELAVEVSDVRT